MPAHEHRERLADEELLHHIASEECPDCFALLFHRYCRQVFSVALKILRDVHETEDIVQEVFLAIYLQRERYDPERGTVRTWILQFAYFKALLRRRYLRIRNFYKQEEVSEARELRRIHSPAPLGMTPAECARYVEAGMASLKTKHRQVIELVHFEGYTLQEASEITRETLANTRNSYYRGLKALRNHLRASTPLKKVQETVVIESNDEYGFQH